jgi:hypothetical protein
MLLFTAVGRGETMHKYLLVLIMLGTVAWSAVPNRVEIKGKEYYLNGINVAWDKFGNDVQQFDSVKFEGMFSELASINANSIRWWWFPQMDNMTYGGQNNQEVQPLSQASYDNLDQAFRMAARHGIKIMPVLVSFDLKNSGRTWIMTDETAMTAFINNIVTPLVTRYNDHEAMGLWEIMNEPEWVLAKENGSLTDAQVQRFHGKVAAAIHAADDDALVTTGLAMYKYIDDFSDAALQAESDNDPLAYLDVYQVHYYSWMHGDGWSYEPWIKTATEWIDDGKPVLVGEFACKGEEGRWTPSQMHMESVNKGYAGSFCWAYFDNRADKEGYWVDAEAPMLEISQAIPDYMDGIPTGTTSLLNGSKGVSEKNGGLTMNSEQTFAIAQEHHSVILMGAIPAGSLYSLQGQLLRSFAGRSGRLELDLSSFAVGLYSIRLQDGSVILVNNIR